MPLTKEDKELVDQKLPGFFWPKKRVRGLKRNTYTWPERETLAEWCQSLSIKEIAARVGAALPTVSQKLAKEGLFVANKRKQHDVVWDEIDLEELARKHDVSRMAEILGVTYSTVKRVLTSRGIDLKQPRKGRKKASPPKIWSLEDDRILGTLSDGKAAALLNCSAAQVKARRTTLNVSRHQPDVVIPVLAQAISTMKEWRITTGRMTPSVKRTGDEHEDTAAAAAKTIRVKSRFPHPKAGGPYLDPTYVGMVERELPDFEWRTHLDWPDTATLSNLASTMTLSQMCEHLDINKITLRTKLRELGISFVKEGSFKKNVDWDSPYILEMSKTKSAKEIGLAMGVNSSTVKAMLKKRGIEPVRVRGKVEKRQWNTPELIDMAITMTLTDMAHHFGVTVQTMKWSLDSRSIRPFKKVVVVDFDDPSIPVMASSMTAVAMAQKLNISTTHLVKELSKRGLKTSALAARQAVSAAMSERQGVPVMVTDPAGVVTVYPSMREALRKLGFPKTSATRAMKKGIRYAGFLFVEV